MRAFTFVLALVFSQLLSFAPVSAKLNCKTAYARAPTPTSPDLSPLALRQHHEPRNLLNICIDLDTDAILGDSVILGIPLKDLLGLDLCLCLSALPLDLSVNAKLRALGDKYGDSVVNAVLSILINTNPKAKHCSYPSNASPVCASGDPCGWDCKLPYVKQGDQCACAAQYVSCNGQCVPASKGCGSAVPHALNARNGLLHARGRYSTSVNYLAEAQASCKPRETVCGVPGSTQSAAFECVNTHRDLESCGGCMVPNPFTPFNTTAPVGRDCTAIEGADTVKCVRGACSVQSCQHGWAVNAAMDGCVDASAVLTVQSPRAKRVASRLFVDEPVHPSADEEGQEGDQSSGYAAAFWARD